MWCDGQYHLTVDSGVAEWQYTDINLRLTTANAYLIYTWKTSSFNRLLSHHIQSHN